MIRAIHCAQFEKIDALLRSALPTCRDSRFEAIAQRVRTTIPVMPEKQAAPAIARRGRDFNARSA
jgi:hypothetical protein